MMDGFYAGVMSTDEAGSVIDWLGGEANEIWYPAADIARMCRSIIALSGKCDRQERHIAEMAEKYAAQSRALSQAAERRAELAWTKVPPIEAGWYWTRSNNEPNPTMRLCELVTTWKGEYLPVEGLDMKWIGLEWAGPVRPPSLPRPASRLPEQAPPSSPPTGSAAAATAAKSSLATPT